MSKSLGRRAGCYKEGRSGTGNLHGIYSPYEHDPTRGGGTRDFPSMHDAEPRTVLVPITCYFCGLQYGWVARGAITEGVCARHIHFVRAEKIVKEARK